MSSGNVVTIDSAKFGYAIKIKRNSMGLKLHDVSERIKAEYDVNISPSYLSMIENSKKRKISEEIYQALIDFYNRQSEPVSYKTFNTDKKTELKLGDFVNEELNPLKKIPVLQSSNIEKSLSYENIFIPFIKDFSMIIHIEDDNWFDWGLSKNDLVLCKKISNSVPLVRKLVAFKYKGKLCFSYIEIEKGYLGLRTPNTKEFLTLIEVGLDNLLGYCVSIIKYPVECDMENIEEMSILRNIDVKKLIKEISRRYDLDNMILENAITLIKTSS